MPELFGFEEDCWDSFWSQAKFVVIQWNWGDSFCVNVKDFLMGFIKSSNKASQTSINVNTNVILQTKFGQLWNWINNSMRIIWIRSDNQYCIAVNHWLHMLKIHLIVISEFRFSYFNVEVETSFIDGSMDWIGNDTALK